MKILILASESAPLAKTGGLADAVGGLTRELRRLGQDVKLVLPRYPEFDRVIRDLHEIGKITVPAFPHPVEVTLESGTLPEEQVPVLGIRYDPFFARSGLYGEAGRDYPDNLARMSLLCRAALDACGSLPWVPDILHAHDWQAALGVAYLKTLYQNDPRWASCRTLFTIHNMSYQGKFPGSAFPTTGLPTSAFALDYLEFFGQVNLLKGGLTYSDMVNTVSPTYAQEIQTPEFGCGLEGVLQHRKDRLCGILNGIDDRIWNPATDPYLPARYSTQDLAGKKLCKTALQREMKLPVLNVPLLGIVSRLVAQKGIDMVLDILPKLLTMDVQLMVLGSGEPAYQTGLTELSRQYPQKMAVSLTFDEGLAHRIEAGADLFLMPSRYEPCGLNQMYSLQYGTVPIVRKTGGLADTVIPYQPSDLSASSTGFMFETIHPEVLLTTLMLALQVYRDKDEWQRLIRRGMKRDFSWKHAAQQYVELYQKMLATTYEPVSLMRDTFPRGRFRG